MHFTSKEGTNSKWENDVLNKKNTSTEQQLE